eukprot:scaffold89156_cov20-Tisochrysis_lutea.AAC.5
MRGRQLWERHEGRHLLSSQEQSLVGGAGHAEVKAKCCSLGGGSAHAVLVTGLHTALLTGLLEGKERGVSRETAKSWCTP